MLAAFLIWAPVAQAWSWPVQGPVLQRFSYDEAHPYDAGQHRGIDIGATASGDPVVAPAAGTVSFAGFVPSSGQSLTIETADGYSVTLTHLGSIAVAEGASVSEGDAIGTIGPSGTPEETVPYVHLGIRLTADPLGYLDPLGLLPAPQAPTPTPTPEPQPVPKPVPVHVPAPARGGGLVIEQPVPVPSPSAAAPAEAPAAPRPRPRPKPKPTPTPAPAGDIFRADAPQIRRPVAEPAARSAPGVAKQVVHAIEVEPLVLSVAPGIVAALLALVTAFTRGRKRAPLPAVVIPFRKELPLRRAA